MQSVIVTAVKGPLLQLCSRPHLNPLVCGSVAGVNECFLLAVRCTTSQIAANRCNGRGRLSPATASLNCTAAAMSRLRPAALKTQLPSVVDFPEVRRVLLATFCSSLTAACTEHLAFHAKVDPFLFCRLGCAGTGG